jgi:hypothetical protein
MSLQLDTVAELCDAAEDIGSIAAKREDRRPRRPAA